MMRKLIKIIIFFIFLSNHSQADVVDQLNKLNDLFKAGVISKEEFTKGKSIILNTKGALGQ
ncbi:SHOCT domain-containing protein [Candidatus Pelagibacter sp.]|nr:SHOCT domain-containing protein [Candidatus Pelagibacter sp.]